MEGPWDTRISDGGTVSRGTDHGEKNHDQAEADTPATTGVPAANSGHTQARAMPADGVPAALHAFLDANATGSAGNARLFDGASNARPATGPQNATTTAGRAATESQLPDGPVLPVAVNTGRLLQRIQESEINLNVRSADFGNVAIHTAMSHERVSAQISLEHIDLGKAIASEVQALQSKLSQEHGRTTPSSRCSNRASRFLETGDSNNKRGGSSPPMDPVLRQEPTQTAMVPPAVLNEGRLDIRV